MTDAEISKIMQIPVSELAKIASQPEELLLMLSVALNKGIQIGSERILRLYNAEIYRQLRGYNESCRDTVISS